MSCPGVHALNLPWFIVVDPTPGRCCQLHTASRPHGPVHVARVNVWCTRRVVRVPLMSRACSRRRTRGSCPRLRATNVSTRSVNTRCGHLTRRAVAGCIAGSLGALRAGMNGHGSIRTEGGNRYPSTDQRFKSRGHGASQRLVRQVSRRSAAAGVCRCRSPWLYEWLYAPRGLATSAGVVYGWPDVGRVVNVETVTA